ncbi:hypothetical protein PIB30_099143 [Stylosanthes scabra]|uniref:Uncharacterized protein n=1 Tax=Stylosanthes scabra TaxID=79078 RepID=A0ABU6ZVH9_9FABA|nr:hypothetical protein [Stylosanthes scabra]
MHLLGNKDKQILNFDAEIERTLHKLRKQSKLQKQTHKISSEEVVKEVLDNMAEGGNQRRTLADFTIPTTASCGRSIVWSTIEANNFELKPSLIHLVQQDQFSGSLFDDRINTSPLFCIYVAQ